MPSPRSDTTLTRLVATPECFTLESHDGRLRATRRRGYSQRWWRAEDLTRPGSAVIVRSLAEVRARAHADEPTGSTAEEHGPFQCPIGHDCDYCFELAGGIWAIGGAPGTQKEGDEG